jgi:hypothetical protein
VICDEVAFWRSEDSATPDVETHGAVQPGLARMRSCGSMLILISTAHKRSGLLYAKWKDAYGRNDPDVLVVRGTTLQFNPTFDAKIIERQIASDPQLYRAEYLSEWRDDLATFISRDLLEAAIDVGVLVRPPIEGTKYLAFADASGGVGDSFTLGIAHRAGDSSVVLDLLFEKCAPFDPYAVTLEIVKLLKTYHCPTGRDRVDHGRAGRDDACNAAAGALVLAAQAEQLRKSSTIRSIRVGLAGFKCSSPYICDLYVDMKVEVTNGSNEALSSVSIGLAFVTNGTCPSSYAEQHTLHVELSPGETRADTIENLDATLSKRQVCMKVVDVAFARAVAHARDASWTDCSGARTRSWSRPRVHSVVNSGVVHLSSEVKQGRQPICLHHSALAYRVGCGRLAVRSPARRAREISINPRRGMNSPSRGAISTYCPW